MINNKHEKLKNAIDSLDEFSKAAWNVSCDEEKAKSVLFNFFDALKSVGANKKAVYSNRGSYYSFVINLIPLQKALKSSKYALACHELRTLCRYEPFLQERIYNSLMILYEKYLEVETE